MITREIRLTVVGHPTPKGSLICCRDKRHSLREDNKNTKPWRTEIARQAKQAKQRPIVGQALLVEVTSTLLRPAAHFGTGRNSAKVKASAPRFPTNRGTGDVDKLVRLVLDALQDSGVLVDDCQVVEVTSRKAYPDNAPTIPDVLEHAGAVIRIYPLNEE